MMAMDERTPHGVCDAPPDSPTADPILTAAAAGP